jgi:hypothetical protein
MEHNETGYQSPPEAPKLCANNCGFFGSAATMNMCSKCHKDLVLQQEHEKLASASIESITTSCVGKNNNPVAVLPQAGSVELVVPPQQTSATPFVHANEGVVVKAGPTRCSACKKRVGLMGFDCRCGSIFCGVHRYSDQHSCPFDYQSAAREAIAKANPVVKADKLDRI